MGGDGQITLENTIMKQGARKVRRLYQNRVIAGFAGAAGDALALFERFEGKLEETAGNLPRAAYQLVKEWRTDRALRQLQALLVVADATHLLLISGNGDLIEPDDGILAVGSGGPFALAARQRAARPQPALGRGDRAGGPVRSPPDICVYTNRNLTVEVA